MKTKVKKFNKTLYVLSFCLLFTNISLAQTLDELLDMNLKTITEIDIGRGKSGSFATRLAEVGDKVKINGWLTSSVILRDDKKKPFFSQEDFHLGFSGEISNKLQAEILMMWQNMGKHRMFMNVLIDYKIKDYFIIRTGLFPIPFGEFNEYIFPSYLNKMASVPSLVEVAVAPWSQEGIQFRGSFELGNTKAFKPYYSVYFVNGLQGDPGSELHNMVKFSMMAANSQSTFAYGFKAGIYYKQITIGMSLYNGIYNDEHNLGLLIAGISFALEKEKLSVFGEYYYASQEAFSDSLSNMDNLAKSAFYIQTAYKINKIEPIIRFDMANIQGHELASASNVEIPEEFEKKTITTHLGFGINYYITETSIIKLNYYINSHSASNDHSNENSGQLGVIEDLKFKIQFVIAF